MIDARQLFLDRVRDPIHPAGVSRSRQQLLKDWERTYEDMMQVDKGAEPFEVLIAQASGQAQSPVCSTYQQFGKKPKALRGGFGWIHFTAPGSSQL